MSLVRRSAMRILLVAACVAAPWALEAQEEPRVFQIGMIDSLFEETDEKQILAQMKPFVDLVKKLSV